LPVSSSSSYSSSSSSAGTATAGTSLPASGTQVTAGAGTVVSGPRQALLPQGAVIPMGPGSGPGQHLGKEKFAVGREKFDEGKAKFAAALEIMAGKAAKAATVTVSALKQGAGATKDAFQKVSEKVSSACSTWLCTESRPAVPRATLPAACTPGGVAPAHLPPPPTPPGRPQIDKNKVKQVASNIKEKTDDALTTAAIATQVRPAGARVAVPGGASLRAQNLRGALARHRASRCPAAQLKLAKREFRRDLDRAAERSKERQAQLTVRQVQVGDPLAAHPAARAARRRRIACPAVARCTSRPRFHLLHAQAMLPPPFPPFVLSRSRTR
jgi:hypothetical protein